MAVRAKSAQMAQAGKTDLPGYVRPRNRELAAAAVQAQIDKVKLTVKTDAYSMSVGEILNLYLDDDLVINPDFQRLFRWSAAQKSRLIESMLLGIPIPSIFVYETAGGQWELVDGLQRVSTIIEFTGSLPDPADPSKLCPPSVLTGTRYLPSLQNVVWELSEEADIPADDQVPLEKSLQLAIKRSRLGVEILKRPSDSKAKYDLFQRLNSGGSLANRQELRNCAVVMVDPALYRLLRELLAFEAFVAICQFNDKQRKSQEDIEFVTRFFVYRYVPYDGRKDVEDYIDDGIMEIAEKSLLDRSAQDNFKATFRLLRDALGDDGLKHASDGAFKGPVGFTALEVVAVGISFNLASIQARKDPGRFIADKVHAAWANDDVKSFSRGGLRGTQRIQRSVPFGKHWFGN